MCYTEGRFKRKGMMNMSWVRVLQILDSSMTTPEAYGWFHVFFFVLSIAAGIVLCIALPNGKKYAPRVVVITAAVVLVLEIYKMINFGFSYKDGVDFAFPWGSFPFQFCSTPMYAGLLTALFRKGHIHDSLCAYLATYAVFAGLCVMVYPGDVFIDTIGINVQTMICHGSMLTVGIYLYGSGYVKAEHKTILKAIPVFCAMVLIAVALNEWAFRTGLTKEHYFNMFYFSPYLDGHLPLYSDVQAALGVDNPLSFIIYVAGFTLAAYLMLLIAIGVRALLTPAKKRKIFA